MANVTSGVVWELGTLGIIKDGPVVIQRVVFVPTTKDHECRFNFYNKSDVVASAAQINFTGTITNAKTLTTTAGIATGIVAGDIFDIIASTGAAANVGRRLVESITSDDAVTIVEDNWTNEEAKSYSYDAYTGRCAVYLKAGATDASPVTIDFGDKGRFFPNLVLTVLTAGKAYVYLK